jgi:hypothetical protein
VRPAVVSLAILAATGFALAGVAYLIGQSWWPGLAATASAASLALIAATFTPWWSAALLIDLAILYAAWRALAGPLTGD